MHKPSITVILLADMATNLQCTIQKQSAQKKQSSVVLNVHSKGI
jgi:hypothetical protein